MSRMISIIMPVYNSEQYLEETIQSILRQSYENFELLLIDDGSSDQSGEICDSYAEKDGRIKAAHQRNGGICAARNRGLDLARGDYIAFCDNDDIFLEGLLEDNIGLACQYDADVVRFGRRMTVMRGEKIISVSEMKNFPTCYIAKEDFAEGFNLVNNSGEGVWAGLYKRSFIEEHHIRFKETMKYGYEDLDFVTQLYLCTPSIVMNNKVYYDWILRYQHSTSGKTNINNIEALVECLELKEKLIKKHQIERRYPDLWLEELSKKIYTVVRYVSPKKVKMPLKRRIEIIRYFGRCKVFENAYRKSGVNALKKKGISAYAVYMLFVRKNYLALYLLIITKQYLVGE